MKIGDIVEGERYEVSVNSVASRKSFGRKYEGEVIKVRAFRKVRRNGWYQTSKKPDGVEVELLIDGEGFPDNIAVVHPTDVIRLWSEKVAEDQQKDEARRKSERRMEIEVLRSDRANGIITDALGKLDPNSYTSDRRGERVKMNIRNVPYSNQTTGSVWVESVDVLVRLADLVQKGIEHERDCL